MTSPSNALYAFVGAFIDELARAGVQHVCICPGSRSTPLAMGFVQDPRIRIWMHLDERSASFFALGLAARTQQAVALVCTSGTAAANFMPAVVEARQARVPLLVLTADRPPELRDCGAPQTIDQLRFYGTQAKWAVEMPLPEASNTLLRFARTTAGRAVATAQEAPAGPVHLNFPFREPLIPTQGEVPVLEPEALRGRPNAQPYVRTMLQVAAESGYDRAAADLAEQLKRAPRGLIVCGPASENELLPEKVTALARSLGYPILSDPLSGLRNGAHDRLLVIDNYDAFLRDETFAHSVSPLVVLRFGAMPTSKPLLQYLQRHPEAHQIVVDRAGWREPTLLATEMIHAAPNQICEALARTIDWPADSAWSTFWHQVNTRTAASLSEQLRATDELFEGRAMAELAELLPHNSVLFAGNSMPVRDIDTFFHGSERSIRILGNRGASGIDGVVSSALGVSAAATDTPVVLAIGDISFYHDMNGLLAAKHYGLNLTVVLVNNDGGGIFHFLPQAGFPESFETLFGTPHGLDFAHAASLYGARFTRVGGWDEYRTAVRLGIEQGGLHIVEVPTDRERNVTLHRRFWPAISAAIAPILQEYGDAHGQ